MRGGGKMKYKKKKVKPIRKGLITTPNNSTMSITKGP